MKHIFSLLSLLLTLSLYSQQDSIYDSPNYPIELIGADDTTAIYWHPYEYSAYTHIDTLTYKSLVIYQDTSGQVLIQEGLDFFCSSFDGWYNVECDIPKLRGRIRRLILVLAQVGEGYTSYYYPSHE